MTSEPERNDRVERMRYRIDLDSKRRWEVCWVRELDSDLAEHWHIIQPGGTDGDAELTGRHGDDPRFGRQLWTVDQLGAAIDVEIPPTIARELEADQAAFPFVDGAGAGD